MTLRRTILAAAAGTAVLLCLPSLGPPAGANPAGGSATADVGERLSRIEQAMWNRDAGAVPFLREWAVRDGNERVRERSIGALVHLRDAAARDVYLGRLKGDPSPRVRRAAVEAIGLLNIGVPIDILSTRLQKDPDPLVRAECARAIGRIGRPEGGTALILGLVMDPSPAVRALSAEALSRSRLPEAVEPLKNAVVRDRSPLVQIYAVRTLARVAPAASRDLFAETWKTTGDADLRVETFRGLLLSDDATVWIRAGLADKDDMIRFLSFQKWVSLLSPPPKKDRVSRLTPPIPGIEPFLSDPARGIRDIAREALERYGFKVRESGFRYVIEE